MMDQILAGPGVPEGLGVLEDPDLAAQTALVVLAVLTDRGASVAPVDQGLGARGSAAEGCGGDRREVGLEEATKPIIHGDRFRY